MSGNQYTINIFRSLIHKDLVENISSLTFKIHSVLWLKYHKLLNKWNVLNILNDLDYPKWFNKNGLVTIDLSTKEVDGVTVKDVILAYTAEHIA